jgi:hypothetical protein
MLPSTVFEKPMFSKAIISVTIQWYRRVFPSISPLESLAVISGMKYYRKRKRVG